MTTQELLDPKSWAERTFGGVQLHDMRRTRRAVQAASKLAENPLGSLPAQMQTWKETKALYRLLDQGVCLFQHCTSRVGLSPYWPAAPHRDKCAVASLLPPPTVSHLARRPRHR